MALLDFIKRVTGIETYDASDSEVIVANYPLSDFTRVVITNSETSKLEVGVDPSYQVPVSIVPTTSISISLLPNSEDVEYLESLQDYLEKNGGYFNITVSNSGKFRGTYSCFFLNDSDVVIDTEPDDEVFEFGAVREDRGLSARPLFRTENNLVNTNI
jgi:hypothetical protein